MITEDKLRQTTKDFFRHYWNPNNGHPPEWSEHWDFNSSIPNHDKRGCYALIQNKEIIYIGVGIGKSFGQYHGSGLGDRLKRYWKLCKDNKSLEKYKAADKWKEVTSIITIGFDEDHYHIAAALEIFIINKLSPPKNCQHK